MHRQLHAAVRGCPVLQPCDLHVCEGASCPCLCVWCPPMPAGEDCLLQPGGYTCPKCKARVAELPSQCHVCGLSLVSSPHLARSYHHLFPIKPFAEVPQQEVAAATVSSACKDGCHPQWQLWVKKL